MRVRDRLGEVFADEPFTEAFGGRGTPGLSPAVLSLVTVVQFAENLTERQAAAMAARAIDWKYAIGVELTDTGFDATVLSRFRTRLAEHSLELVVFDRLLEVCREQGLVGAGGKQRTDSTHVISAVRDLNRTELAGESVRAALEVLVVAAGGRPAGAVDVPELAHRYEERVNGWTMPSSKTKRDRLAVVFGQDPLALCRAVWAPGAPGRPGDRAGGIPAQDARADLLRVHRRAGTGGDREAGRRQGRRLAGPSSPGLPLRPWCTVGGQGRRPVLARPQGPPHRNLRHSGRSRSPAVTADHGCPHHRGERPGRQGHPARPAEPHRPRPHTR
ncbi:transposase [Streptomyces sp. NPDC101234]|uniref:transposase n=1 Tax=Streptomyces sp. NPDC101234 TaxID=3366138 RepID=UPI00381C6BB9